MEKYKYNYAFRHKETYKGYIVDVKANTKKSLNKKVNDRKVKIDNRCYNQTNMTVEEWFDYWLENIKRESVGADSTYRTYKTQVSRIKREMGLLKLSDVKPLHCQQALNGLAGKAKSYMKKTRDTLSQGFEVAAQNGMIATNPAAHLKYPNASKKAERAVLSDALRRTMLEVAKTHYAGSWIKIMLLCGLRPSETERVMGKDVDVEVRQLHIRGTKTEKSDRFVPIPESLIDDLSGFKHDEYVFLTEKGSRLKAQARERWWKSFKRDVHLAMGGKLYRNQIIDDLFPRGITQYSLRHTYATDLITAKIELNSVRDLMGHTNINTTNGYVHSHNGYIEKVRNEMDKYHSSKETH